MNALDIGNELVGFIRSLHKTEDFIPLHVPVFSGNEQQYVEECISSTFVSSVGKYVDDFEHALAAYTSAESAVLCVNGTEALTLALKLFGVTTQTEVITQPLSFVATTNAIVHAGGSPVFVDIDQETMGLSPEALWRFFEGQTEQRGGICFNRNSGKKIVCCVPMHTFGHPAKVDEIVDVCLQFGVIVVEDAAESLGSFYKGKHTGTFGAAGVISFNGNKVITTGGGGVILFKDKMLGRRAKHLTTQAKIPHPWEYDHDEIGYNLRMPNINAAIGLAQLEMIDQLLGSKRELAKKYNEYFTRSSLKFVTEPENAKSNYWLNTVICEDRTQRDSLLKHTNDAGVMTRPAWKLISSLAMMKDYQADDLKVARSLADKLVNLPSTPVL